MNTHHSNAKGRPSGAAGSAGEGSIQESDAPLFDQPADRQFSWNLLCHGIEIDADEALQNVLRQRVDELAGRLKSFAAEEAVHLHVALKVDEATAGGSELHTRIDLRLPATVLHGDAINSDFAESMKGAFDVLEKRLQSYLVALRGEHRWKNFSRRRKGAAAAFDTDARSASPGFGAPAITGPETREDVIRNFILRHYHRLLLYVHRRIIASESELSIPLTSVDAREVLDEVTRVCLSDPGAKPQELSYELWLYRLIDDELKRICEEISERDLLWDEVPVEATETDLLSAGSTDEQGLGFEEWMSTSFDSDDAYPDEEMPDSAAVPPDMSLLGKDLVSRILEVSSSWPEDQREILQLYFLEGFDAVEIAMIRGMESAQVDEVIAQLRARLQQLLRDEKDA